MDLGKYVMMRDLFLTQVVVKAVVRPRRGWWGVLHAKDEHNLFWWSARLDVWQPRHGR